VFLVQSNSKTFKKEKLENEEKYFIIKILGASPRGISGIFSISQQAAGNLPEREIKVIFNHNTHHNIGYNIHLVEAEKGLLYALRIVIGILPLLLCFLF